jgi:lambda family phage tail tape measure protein
VRGPEARAAQLGVSQTAAPFIDQMKKAGESTHEFGLKTAGARRELLVLAHEASQGSWKNFGGSLMVMGEKIDIMSKVLSPAGIGIGLLSAAVTGFVIAAYNGSQESDRLDAAIANTGGFAGRTAGQINQMAVSLGGMYGGVTKAQNVLAGLIETGRFSGDALDAVAASVLAISKATGQDADKVIEQYARMSDGVATWADEQNRQYHFLSLAAYNHIKALEEMGEKGVAEKAVADALTDALGRQHQQLGWLPAAWHAVGDAAAAAWRQMMNAGKPTSAEDKLAALKQELNAAQTDLAAGGQSAGADGATVVATQDDMKSRIKALQTQIANQQAFVDNEQKFATQQADRDKIHQAAIDASNELDKSLESLDKDYAKSAALRKLYQQFAALKHEYEATGEKPSKYQDVAFNVHTGEFSGGLYDKAVADINDRYRDKQPKHQKAYTDDAATRMLQSLREEDAAMRAQLATTDKLTNAQRELEKFNQQIADLKGKAQLTADQKSLLVSQDAIKVQLQKNAATERELQQKQALAKLDERSAEVMRQIAQYRTDQADGYQRSLGAVGMGAQAQQQAQALNQIQKEYQRYLDRLTKETPKDLLDSETFKADAAKIEAAMQDSLKAANDYYDALRARQADWRNGAAEAFADYRDSAANILEQTKGLFNDVFKGMEDAIVSFAMTGKLSVKDMVNSIIADYVRMQARTAISAGLGWLQSAASSYFTVGHADGGYITGPGTGRSDSINARLSNGEFVVNAAAVAQPGMRAMLEHINGGSRADGWQRFADGGYVGSSVASTATGSRGGDTLNVELHGNGQSSVGGGGFSPADVASLKQLLGGWMDKRLAERMGGQGGYAYQMRYGQIR